MSLLNRRTLIAFLSAAPLVGSDLEGRTAPIEIKKGKEVAVRYRARIAGDVLWVEAMHSPGWHACALGNGATRREENGNAAARNREINDH